MIKHILVILLTTLFVNSAWAGERIVTIGGALTEIVYALGGADKLVGSDTTSYFPPEAKNLPKVGYMRALSTEGILSLNPDMIILTEEAGPPAVLAQLKQTGVEIVYAKAARSMDDIKQNINRIAFALKIDDSQLIQSIEEDEHSLTKALVGNDTTRAMFILQVGNGAPMVAGLDTAADSILKMAGVQNVVSDYEGYKPLTPEAAVAMAPDFLLTTDRGIHMAGGMDNFKKIPGINLTEPAQAGHVIAMDDLLLIGFGPRTAKATLELHYRYKAL